MHVIKYGRPPTWLEDAVAVVMLDLQGAHPVDGVAPVVALLDSFNGVSLMLVEVKTLKGPLKRLPEAEELEPTPAVLSGGGNAVPRGLIRPELLVRVAEILQEDLAETTGGWGQARPPCPHHPHPARPVIRDEDTWWTCERLAGPLYRIGQGEVPAEHRPPPSWESGSRRARKRAHKP